MSIHVKKYIKPAAAVLFAAYLFYLAYLVFFSHLYGRGYVHRSISLMPFRTILQYLHSFDTPKAVVVNLLGNISAFVPMGFLLPIVSEKCKRLRNVFWVVMAATVVIEIMQYAAGVGAADVDDVLLNVLGGMIGYGVVRVIGYRG